MPGLCHLANNRAAGWPTRLTWTVMESRFEAEVTVRFVRYANEATGWAVVDAAAADGTPVALVGPLVHLEERERVHVTGTWVNDSRYGAQVKVSEARPLPPQDLETLVGYLKRVKHVGAKRAADLQDTIDLACQVGRVEAAELRRRNAHRWPAGHIATLGS